MSSVQKLDILVMGNIGVGKTSFLKQFVDNKFDPNPNPTTIGIDLLIRKIKINDKNYKLKFWDTAGQEKFRSISLNVYKKADGIILMYSMDDNQSFLDCQYWFKQIQYYNLDTQILLVGNKKDLGQLIELDSGFLNNIKNYKVSSKSGENVQECIEVLVLMIQNSHKNFSESIIQKDEYKTLIQKSKKDYCISKCC